MLGAGDSSSASPEDQKRQMLLQGGLMVFMFIAMYLVLIRPQQKKSKEQSILLKGLKNGDKVVTSSGILGVVTSVRDDSVTIRSADTKLELQKSAIVQITERAA
jgi:preprotein translocase subunit YajC